MLQSDNNVASASCRHIYPSLPINANLKSYVHLYKVSSDLGPEPLRAAIVMTNDLLRGVQDEITPPDSQVSISPSY